MKNKGTLKRILQYAKPYRSSLVFAMIFALLYVVLNLTAPVLVGYAIDNIVDKENVKFNDVATLLMMVGITVLACAVFQWLMGLCINTVSYGTVRDMRRDIFRKFNTDLLR